MIIVALTVDSWDFWRGVGQAIGRVASVKSMGDTTESGWDYLEKLLPAVAHSLYCLEEG